MQVIIGAVGSGVAERAGLSGKNASTVDKRTDKFIHPRVGFDIVEALWSVKAPATGKQRY